jgi:hypothetical protein
MGDVEIVLVGIDEYLINDYMYANPNLDLKIQPALN